MDGTINTKVWKFTIAESKSIGHEERSRKRAKQRQTEETRVLEYLKKECPSWLDTSINVIDQESVNKVIDALEFKANGNNSLKFMNNFIFRCLKEGNRLGVWEAALPSLILTQRREKPFRTMQQFSSLNEFRHLKSTFIDWLNESDDFNLNVKRGAAIRMRSIVDAILISAVVFGGLVNPKELSALMKSLIKDGVDFANDSIWIDLYVIDKSQSVTINEYKPEARIRRWFPDRLTLSLIALWSNQDLRVNTRKIDDAFKRLKLLAGNNVSSITTYRQFLSTSVLAYEIDNPRTESFLQAYLIGKNESHSLPKPVWLKLFGVHTKCEIHEPSKRLVVKEKELENNRASINVSTKYRRDTEFFIKELRSNFVENENQKLQKDQIIEQIDELLTRHGKDALPVEQLLAYWVINLLKFGTRYKPEIAISTCRTYLSVIGTEIIATVGEDNPLEYDTEQWNDKLELFTQNTLDRGGKVRQKVARLEEFYDFLMHAYGIPAYEFSCSIYSKTGQPRVNSNYINIKEYELIKKNIGKNLNLEERYVSSMVQLFVLAYRTGVRKHELRKLRVKDIFHDEQTQSLLMRVRVNKLGDNKTTNARRTIPLNDLLNEQELKAFLNWFQIRSSMKSNKNDPLFIQQGSECNKLTDGDIHKVFSKLIKNVCNDISATFHSLRHSGLSNIFITTFIEEFDWPFEFSLYPQLGLKKHTLVSHYGIQSGKKLHAISLLAGHHSPIETLSTYVHVLDFLQHVRRKVVDDDITPQLINKLLGWPKGNYARHIKRNFEIREYLYKPLAKGIKSDKIKCHTKATTWEEVNENMTSSQSEPVKVTHYSDIDDVHLISLLKDYESGKSISTLSEVYALSIRQIERTIGIAKMLANLRTKKGSKRLISTLRERNFTGAKESENIELISPSSPRQQKDKRLARTILDAMLLSLKNKNETSELAEVIRVWITNTSANKPGIKFPSSKSACRYIKSLEKWVPKKNICLISKFPMTEFPDRDRGYTPGYRIDHSAQGNRYYLLVVSADEVSSQVHGPKVISSSAVAFAMHTMAIMMLSRYAYAIKF